MFRLLCVDYFCSVVFMISVWHHKLQKYFYSATFQVNFIGVIAITTIDNEDDDYDDDAIYNNTNDNKNWTRL